MKEFFMYLITQWWGVTIICVLIVSVWLLLSALLYKPFFKRFYDVVLSALALLVLSPVLLLLIVLGAIKMKGNPFFTQLRPGKIDKKTGKERIFRLIKLRTMTNERDENGELLPDEKRLTKYGKFLRSTSLDELFELINIFKGDMSIVGPRPQLVRDMVFMDETQRKRHKVCPGLTGLAQVKGRNNITWEQKFEYDLEYVEKITLWKDLKIVFATAWKVLKRSDVAREGTVSDIDFGDWLLQEGKISNDFYNAKQRMSKEYIKEH